MTREEIKSRWPHATESTIRRNLDRDPELRPPEPRQQAIPLAARGKGEAQGGGCPIVSFAMRRERLLDVDAKYAAVKHLLDGVVATGIVAGDKEGQISLEVTQTKCLKGETEITVVTITKPNT